MREHFVVPSIGRRDVACAEWPNIRRFEHFLQLLNVANDALNVHFAPISNKDVAIVKLNGIWMRDFSVTLTGIHNKSGRRRGRAR